MTLIPAANTVQISHSQLNNAEGSQHIHNGPIRNQIVVSSSHYGHQPWEVTAWTASPQQSPTSSRPRTGSSVIRPALALLESPFYFLILYGTDLSRLPSSATGMDRLRWAVYWLIDLFHLLSCCHRHSRLPQEYRDLIVDMEHLQRTLIVLKFAINAFDDTTLGHTVVTVSTKLISSLRPILVAVLRHIRTYYAYGWHDHRGTLTDITQRLIDSNLCNSSRRDLEFIDLRSLGKRLRKIKAPLDKLLFALHSSVSMCLSWLCDRELRGFTSQN